MQFPIIHLGGTGHWTLLRGYENALDKVRNAVSALNAVEFNARDYYPLGGGAWETALEERQHLLRQLGEVQEALEAHVAHIDEIVTRRGTP